MQITIDPKMFINPPFKTCPKCKKKEFGVLMISNYQYTRRCRECRYDQTYKLPRLKKKIIYIDQFAISDMMKSINPKTGKLNKVDPFFKELYIKLDRLCKLQLIVCPESTIHFYESIVSGHYQALKRILKQLSNSISFYDPDTIKRFEVENNFLEWFGKKKAKPVDIHSITQDDINAWQDRFIIDVDLRGQDLNLPDALRKERDMISTELNNLFQEWQINKTKSFNDWFNNELESFGKAILQRYYRSIFTFDISDNTVLMARIHEKLREKYDDEKTVLQKTNEYFFSGKIKEISYAIISAALYAALAQQASSGRTKPLTQGMINDITVIATYAPYCDALFIDKECQHILNQGQVKAKYDLSNKVFSRNNKEALMKYLDTIEKSATKKHIDLVKEVYGDNWVTPYVTIFD